MYDLRRLAQSVWRAYFLLFALCFLVYVNSLTNSFISDDITGILRNPHISEPLRYCWQLPTLLHSLNYVVAKGNPFIYHLTNIFLHAIATALVFRFLGLFFKRGSSLLGAILFAVHPIHTEAVTWISGRPYIILAIFILATYFLYRASTEKTFNPRLYFICLAVFTYYLVVYFPFFFLTPFLFMLTDITYKRWKKNWPLWLPFLAIVLVRGLLAKDIVSKQVHYIARISGGPVVWVNPILNTAYSLFSNFSLLVWPGRLTLYHDPVRISHTMLGFEVFLLFTLLIALPFIYRRSKRIFVGIMIFIIMLIPTYMPVMVCCLVAERYLYFPSIILSIFAASCYEKCREKKMVWPVVLLAVIITAYAARTILRNEDWKTPSTFWRATLKASPDSFQVHANMGDTFRKEENFRGALDEFRKAIDVNPNSPVSYSNLGITYAEMGDQERAVAAYKKAIEINPNSAVAHNNLAVAYYYAKEYDLAIRHCDRAFILGYPVSPGFLALLEPHRE